MFAKPFEGSVIRSDRLDGIGELFERHGGGVHTIKHFPGKHDALHVADVSGFDLKADGETRQGIGVSHSGSEAAGTFEKSTERTPGQLTDRVAQLFSTDNPEKGDEQAEERWASRTSIVAGMRNGPTFVGVGLLDLSGRLPTLPHTCACSTIGAEGLNFRVRDGNGWDPLAMVTQHLVASSTEADATELVLLSLCCQELLAEYLNN